MKALIECVVGLEEACCRELVGMSQRHRRGSLRGQRDQSAQGECLGRCFAGVKSRTMNTTYDDIPIMNIWAESL